MNEYECLCGEVIIKNFPDVFQLDGPDGFQETLLQGDLFRLECPQCGRIFKIEERAVVQTSDGRYKIAFLPEEYREQILAGTFELEKPTDRMVVGYKELAEKVLLWRDGLDDRVVEYLKFGFLLKVKKEAILYYAGISNSRLEFWVEGLEEGKIGKTGVPEELYKHQLENIASVLDKPSFQAVLRPPRVCIRDYSWESLP